MKKETERFAYMTSSPDRYNMLKGFARENRIEMTPAETFLWKLLRDKFKTFRFRRQHIIGDFIVDFACIGQHLVIEVDGGYHSEPRQQDDDLLRTESLNRMGFNVIRFTNEQIMQHQQEVIDKIKNILYNE